MRGTLKYHGAATGRWTGHGFQPQNLPRPTLENFDIDAAIAAVLAGDLERVRKIGAPLAVVSELLRSMITAAPGHVLIAGDFSTIESRILAWLAGEAWKIDTFQRFDATNDPALDPYLIAATRNFKRPIAPSDDASRHTGKLCELSFQYGGALGAWRRFDNSDAHSDRDVERFRDEWRAAHPATTQFWRRLAGSAKKALRTGQRIALGNLAFVPERAALQLVLPSGRCIAYPEARLVPGNFDNTLDVAFQDNARGGWNETRGWFGVFVENVVQAIARDLLVAAMWRLEHAGYPIVLHVHDECVAEVPEGRGNVEEFRRLMIEAPAWAAGLPIAAKGRTGQRYSKPTKSRTDAQVVELERQAVAAAGIDFEKREYADDF